MDSFFLMGARPLVEFSPSMKLHELLDWSAIAGQLTGLYQREISGAGGPQPYSWFCRVDGQATCSSMLSTLTEKV